MSLAMHGPNGEYESVNSDEREKELRVKGYLNGHEYFSAQKKHMEAAQREAVKSDIPAVTVVNKPPKKSKA
jgi:hypothetical protein